MPSQATLIRDAALARVRRARRWIIAATAALTAGFAALVAAVAPGKSLSSKAQHRTTAATGLSPTRGTDSGIPKMPPPANPSSLGLGGPDQAPSPVPDQSQPQSPPSAPQPAPAPPSAPAPQSSGGGGAVVSGGS